MTTNPLPRATPESVGFSSRSLLEMLSRLERCGTEMHGFMLQRFGKVVAECWWLPYNKDTVHICHSFGKSYAATAIGLACTQGKLSVEDRIVDLFADEIGAYGVPLTENLTQLKVKHVLSMTNGMSVHAENGEHLLRNYLTTPVDNPPGTVFMYNTTGSCMLGAIVEKVTGRRVREYLEEFVFHPIGMNDSGLAWMTFRNGLHAAPGVASCTENNLRLGMLYLQDGAWEGRQIIDAQWIHEATRKQIDNSAGGYGYQMWMHKTFPDVFRFCGGHGQDCVMSRGRDLAWAINQAASEPHDTDAGNKILDAYLLAPEHPHALPEDPEGYAALQTYLHTRALPNNASQPRRAFADGWAGEYEVVEGRFHIHPELRPYGEKNVYLDFYDTDDVYVKRLCITEEEEAFWIELDGRTQLKARLDGRLIPNDTWSAMPAYTELCSTVVFEKDEMIVDAWFMQTCFRSRLWFTRDGDMLHVRVRKERLHDQEPYFWYNAVLRKRS